MPREPKSSLLWLWILLGVGGLGTVLLVGLVVVGAGFWMVAAVPSVGTPVSSAVSNAVPTVTDPASTKPAPTIPAQAPIVVESERLLWEKYKENVVAADQKYTGKRVEFTAGGQLEKDENGTYYIAYQVISPVPPEVTVPAVKVFLSAKSTHKVANAPTDRGPVAFRIRGVCEGKHSDIGAWDGFFVTVIDCEIIQVFVRKNDGTWTEVK